MVNNKLDLIEVDEVIAEITTVPAYKRIAPDYKNLWEEALNLDLSNEEYIKLLTDLNTKGYDKGKEKFINEYNETYKTIDDLIPEEIIKKKLESIGKSEIIKKYDIQEDTIVIKNITSVENLKKLKAMSKEDRDKLIKTYPKEYQKTIKNYMRPGGIMKAKINERKNKFK
jgi:hypothetical protein